MNPIYRRLKRKHEGLCPETGGSLPANSFFHQRQPAVDENPLMCNAFTVDVEDYFHVAAFDDVVNRSEWPTCESRVVNNTRCLMEILAEYDVCATFFVLGWVAERHPELIREIQNSGHEIGSHSYWHRFVYSITPDEFREDLLRSCRTIEEITGERVRSYRAPSFSITANSLWALDILAEENIEIDSSIYPVRHDLYGIPDASPVPQKITTPSGSIHEFPCAVSEILGLKLPAGGGGYFRQLPWWWTQYCLGQINAKNRPFVFYIHPWEIDPDQPRIKNAAMKSQFRHYRNLDKTEGRLHRLLKSFRFDKLSTLAAGELPTATWPKDFSF